MDCVVHRTFLTLYNAGRMFPACMVMGVGSEGWVVWYSEETFTEKLFQRETHAEATGGC